MASIIGEYRMPCHPSLFLNVPHDVTDHVVLEGEHLVDIPSVDSVFKFPNK